MKYNCVEKIAKYRKDMTSVNTIKINKENTFMIAHRGLSGIETENTAAAFIAGGNRSYYGMECDIHQTIDGVVVIIHDDNTQRISPFVKIIRESTYEELLNTPLYDKDRIVRNYIKIPTMMEYVMIAKKYQKECVIEFKNEWAEADIAQVLNQINEVEYLDHCIFISFFYNNLINIRKHNLEVRLQFLTSKYHENEEMVLKLCKGYNIDLDLYYKTITKELVDKLHALGIKINCWTVDDPIIAEELVKMGVDFITTNILE